VNIERRQMSSNKSENDQFKELTWEDIENWAGSKVLSRGRKYQQGRLVTRLAKTPDGGLIADVAGSEAYTTFVAFRDKGIVSHCTCPYGESCKHAVAVILEYLEQAKKGIKIPTVDSSDPRLNRVKTSPGYDRRYEGDNENNEEDMEEYSTTPNRHSESASQHLKGFLENMSKEELVALLLEQTEKHPSVSDDLQHRQKLLRGDVKKIVASVRKEIQSLSAEPAWRNHWNDEGCIPDYSRVRNRLESLLAAGHADAVIALGEELLTAGVEQVETSDDEGETAEEITSCLDIVFRALSGSSLSSVEQMIWAIDAELEDDFDLCQGANYFWEVKKEPPHWSAVADKLLQRLKRLKPVGRDENFSNAYRRDKLSDWIIEAFKNSGRSKEIIPLCEEEAVNTGNYVRLVEALLNAERKKDAERWIVKGITASQKESPGIAAKLRDTLREMREKEGNWPAVAAIRAEEFFSRPSFTAYNDVRLASKPAGQWPVVRTAVLSYLETGKLPLAGPSWPLPEAEIKLDHSSQQEKPPMVGILIDIAINEKETDEIIRWYDYPAEKGCYGRRWSEYKEDRIADAIEKDYPDRAAAIWKALAEGQISLTKPSAYEAAAVYLKKLHGFFTGQNRAEEWTNYLAGLRQTHARKPRLLQTLARLEGRKIIDEK
jgi:uncharacterized Zn finger protein